MFFSADNLLSPTLDKRFCVVFYALTIVNLLFIALALVTLVILLGDMKKNQLFIWNLIISLVSLIFNYIVSRVLYSMCVKTL